VNAPAVPLPSFESVMKTSARPSLRTRRSRARARPLEPIALDGETVALAQRGRLRLDLTVCALDAAEQTAGPFSEIARTFRTAVKEAKDAWDRLRAVHGLRALEVALERPPTPAAVWWLDAPIRSHHAAAALIVIGGKSYRAVAVPGTPEAPRIWRLSHLPTSDDGPYHACRLADGSTQCDCAEWTYQIQGLSDAPCKHLSALQALGWL